MKATSTDPAQAEKEEKKVHGVLWGMSFDQARELAAAEKRPILIDFTGVNCANCRLMERRVLPRPEVVSLLKKFVTVQLYTDFVPISSITADQREELADENQDPVAEARQGQRSIPFYVVLTPEGEVAGAAGRVQRAPCLRRFPEQGTRPSFRSDECRTPRTRRVLKMSRPNSRRGEGHVERPGASREGREESPWSRLGDELDQARETGRR